MNKSELVSEVALHSGLSKVDSEKAVDSVVHAITEALKKGQEVRLVGFGTFATADRPESEGRNPRTGEKIKISASRTVKFRPGKQLKDSVAP